jgi:hypothetical protein
MLFLQTFVLALAAFFGVFARGSSDVVILSAENFDETVKFIFFSLNNFHFLDRPKLPLARMGIGW